MFSIFSYEIEFECSDAGVPPLTTIRHLTVDVTDVNDNAPRFDRPLYHAEILENNYVGAIVAQLNATDPDDGPNGLIHYALLDNDSDGVSVSGLFSVNPITGTVMANAVLDRERTSRYRIQVRAIDAGVPEPRTGSATLVVSVSDVDDELPFFSMSTYTFTVVENQPTGSSVGGLSAVDADGPPFSKFFFRFRPTAGIGSTGSGEAFSIDRRTGIITTTRPLDREEQDVYEFVAEAISDMTSDDRNYDSDVSFISSVVPGYSSTTTVIVRVLDVNDNRPSFVFPDVSDDATEYNVDGGGASSSIGDHVIGDVGENSGRSRTMTLAVSNRSVRGQAIAEVKAFDPDEGDNATIDYSVIGGNDKQMFSIDSQTGLIRLNVDFVGAESNQVRIDAYQ